ncbi:MAG TPA: hypothetical protein VGI39_04780 [Polyangiaceae bacterium]
MTWAPGPKIPRLADLARRRLEERRRAAARKDRPPKSLEQFLAEDARTYEEFCSRLTVTPKDRKRIPFVPNRLQRRRMAARTPRDVILKARQQGITTEELARDLWHLFTHPRAEVRIVCQSATDHGPLNDIREKFIDFLEALLDDGVTVHFRSESNTRWKLETGSVLSIIEAGASLRAASKKGRGGTITRLHCTELALWEYAGETLNAMLECVPGPETGSEIVYESTPNGAAPSVPVEERDVKSSAGSALFHWAYQDARAGRSEFAAHFFEWWETDEYALPLEAGEDLSPRDDEERFLVARGVTPEQLKWRRKKVTGGKGRTFRQEYPSHDETCFLLSGRSFFDADVTEALLLQAHDPLRKIQIKRTGADGELRIFHEPMPGKEYVVSADTSEGIGGDPCAAHVYERRSGRHMATLDGQLKPWEFARELAGLGRHYFGALIAVERNNHGHTVLRCLDAEQHYGRIFEDADERPGWLTSPATRAPALDTLEEAHRTGTWSTLDKVILGEMRTFVKNEKGRPEAARGAHDEHPMTAMIGWDVLTRVGVGRTFAGVEAF